MGRKKCHRTATSDRAAREPDGSNASKTTLVVSEHRRSMNVTPKTTSHTPFPYDMSDHCLSTPHSGRMPSPLPLRKGHSRGRSQDDPNPWDCLVWSEAGRPHPLPQVPGPPTSPSTLLRGRPRSHGHAVWVVDPPCPATSGRWWAPAGAMVSRPCSCLVGGTAAAVTTRRTRERRAVLRRPPRAETGLGSRSWAPGGPSDDKSGCI